MSIVWTEHMLKNLHFCLMKIILEVDRVCKKNDITYFLAGGTLLGAVREGRFLPWDEDADLMMKREDYDRFCRAAKAELSPDFFIQDHETDPYSHRPYIRIRLNGTEMSTEFSSRFPLSHQGIFVDIFCHDRTSGSRAAQKLHIAQTVMINSLVFRKWENESETKIKKGWKNAVSALFSMKRLEELQNRIYRKYNKKNQGFLYDGMGKHLKNGGFPEKWLESAVEIELEGHKLPVPNGYDEYLTWLYGDYRKPPEREKQVPAANIVRLDFGKWKFQTEDEHEQ